MSAKLPPFWPDKPAVWFAQVEAQFQIAGISQDNTMFNYVIAQLDQKLAGEVEDLITNPPDSGQRYSKLKQELIRRLSMSQEQRVRQLISEEELGDRKPSQFLGHLRSLAGTALSDDNILRQLWIRRLPQQVQAILASQAELSLDRVADLADKVMEVANPNQVYSCAIPTSSGTAATSVLDSLMQKLEELSKQVASLSTGSAGSRHRSRSNSRSGSKRSRDTTPADKSKLCWYHKNYKTKASKCIKPCAWVSQENPNSNQ